MNRTIVFLTCIVMLMTGISYGQLPFTGTITLQGYEWLNDDYEGIMDVKLPEGSFIRLLEGKNPWRHLEGKITFSQGCGDNVQRISVADTDGLITPVSPCSNEIPNPGASPSEFYLSKLSPDEQKVAVTTYYYLDGNYLYSVIVFDLTGEQLAFFEGYYAPEWLADGRLILVGSRLENTGIYMTDVILENLTRLDGGKLNGPVGHLALHPSQKKVAFEYNQQLWQMNLNGSGLEEVVTGPRFYKFPAWSPDGNALAFLGKEGDDEYDNAIYFYDFNTGERYTLPINFSSYNSSLVPLGPLSWRE